MSRVAVVTDSSGALPDGAVEAEGVEVVPIQVVIGARSFAETDPEATPARVAEALREYVPVSTSRPAPQTFLDLYRRLAAEGAREVVSLHLSGEMSGTVEAAQLAARDAPVPVTVVDTRHVGPATGYAAIAAHRALAAGGDAAAAVDAARTQAEASTSLFYVDTLEYLRRGGRVGAAAALLGGALAVKPLLTISEGRVETLEKVRTAGRALHRLEELAVAAAGDGHVDVCVSHLAGEERAGDLVGRLSDRLGDRVGGPGVVCGELGAALGAHVGPGMIAVCVSPHAD
jgi:DegV family protein with EDD domain